MQVNFAYQRLPWTFQSNMVTDIHANNCLSLQQLYQSNQTPKDDNGSIPVGQGQHGQYGLVMVGGHGSIYRALLEAGSNPTILSNRNWLYAYWGVLTRMWHKKLTWLIITSDGFHCTGYENSSQLNPYFSQMEGILDRGNNLVKATPTRLAAELVTLWPNRNFLKKG